MSRIVRIETLQVFTTPEELRRMADQMQETFLRARLGESLVGARFLDCDGVIIELVCDQERMKKT